MSHLRRNNSIGKLYYCIFICRINHWLLCQCAPALCLTVLDGSDFVPNEAGTQLRTVCLVDNVHVDIAFACNLALRDI